MREQPAMLERAKVGRRSFRGLLILVVCLGVLGGDRWLRLRSATG